MLSLDLLDKVAKRLDFHSTAIIFLDFFDKDQTSLNITRLHSTHSTRWPNGSIFSSIFCRVKNRVKNRVVWPGPYRVLLVFLQKRVYHHLHLNNLRYLEMLFELHFGIVSLRFATRMMKTTHGGLGTNVAEAF